MVCTIRGAITIENNIKEEVYSATTEMLEKIIEENNISNEDIININFTCTRDIDCAYPAVAARQIGITEASLMCFQELYVVGSLPMCIRAMVMINTDKAQKDMKHIYLRNAVKLRPDLAKKKIEAVAIDGPAGSGKSTVAKLISSEMGYIYVDTGAMYRTVGYYCIKNNIDYNDSKKVISVLDNINISLKFDDGIQKIYLDSEDVTSIIRTQKVADSASKVAAIPQVREKLVALQKNIANSNKVVMDGRDIGTNVIPDARVKIYLDADPIERAKRRCKELEEKNIKADIEKITEEIIERDNYDKNRKVNPLKVARDAVVIDTSSMSIDEVKNKILEIIRSN
ncbi:MAG: (d)CMP kinase [Lachnospirales bacterium]